MSINGENFIYATLDMPSKEIETINKTIEEVKEIYNCYLSGNNIGDPTCLKELQNLIHLELQRNKIKNVGIFCMEESFQSLMYLDLSQNKFSEFPNFTLPKLEYLDISNNKLEKVNEAWLGHPNLKVLNVADNKFKTLTPFKNCPKLQELYAQNNSVSQLAGYEGLPSLKVLNLRHNRIESIGEELPELPALETINLRTNKIPDMENIFRLLAQFNTIKNINILNCPVELGYSSM